MVPYTMTVTIAYAYFVPLTIQNCQIWFLFTIILLKQQSWKFSIHYSFAIFVLLCSGNWELCWGCSMGWRSCLPNCELHSRSWWSDWFQRSRFSWTHAQYAGSPEGGKHSKVQIHSLSLSFSLSNTTERLIVRQQVIIFHQSWWHSNHTLNKTTFQLLNWKGIILSSLGDKDIAQCWSIHQITGICNILTSLWLTEGRG